MIRSRLNNIQDLFEIEYVIGCEVLLDDSENWLTSKDVELSDNDWGIIGDEILFEELNKIIKENIKKKL